MPLKLKKYKKNVFLALAITALLFSYDAQNIKKAAANQDCSKLTGDAQNQCQDLEKKAQVYQQIIDLKNKQQDTLASQMDIINQEQIKNQTDLQQTQKTATDLAQKIQNLEDDINNQETTIVSQKKILAGLMRSYYEYDQEGVLGLVVLDQNLTDILNQSDYIQQSSTKASDVLSQIIQAKNELKAAQQDLLQKKQESDNMQAILSDKKDTLQSTENQKQILLAQTQGEEAKYQKLLAAVEAQKKELFDFSGASNLSDVLNSVNSYKKPDSKYWDSGHFYSQTDSRWGNMKIGGTKYLMGDYGCAITSVAMVYDFEGKNYTPKTILTSSDFIKKGEAIIYWPDGWNKAAFNKDAINNQLKSGKPVIAHITKGNTDGHFVVIHHYDTSAGSFVVNDPYFGPNLYLETSMSLLGKLGTNTKTSINYIIISN